MPVLFDMNPIRCRTSAGCVVTSYPATMAEPPVGRNTVLRMRRQVVLPAPLGPINPKISPGWTSKLTPSNAATHPRRRSSKPLVRSVTRIMVVSCGLLFLLLLGGFRNGTEQEYEQEQ